MADWIEKLKDFKDNWMFDFLFGQFGLVFLKIMSLFLGFSNFVSFIPVSSSSRFFIIDVHYEKEKFHVSECQ